MSTDKLEQVQYRALRFVFADYESDYNALLVKAKMPTLELARLPQICIQVFNPKRIMRGPRGPR